MSELPIFIIGVVVFAITVYGVVMAGGLLMTVHEIDDNERVYGDASDVDAPDGGG